MEMFQSVLKNFFYIVKNLQLENKLSINIDKDGLVNLIYLHTLI